MRSKDDSGVDLHAAEAILGHTFSTQLLGVTALSTWRAGFSRLEFLGDAILGLAVFSTAEFHHFGRQEAIARVSNDHLDMVFNQSFSKLTESNSGDVIEALIGAIHLDGGFAAAARIATNLCLPEYEFVIPPVDIEKAGIAGVPNLSFVGAAAFSAAVADRFCREQPEQTHRWFSEQRTAAMSRRSLAELSVRLGYSPEGNLDDEKFRAKASDKLEAALGEQYFTRGWEAARESSLRIVQL